MQHKQCRLPRIEAEESRFCIATTVEKQTEVNPHYHHHNKQGGVSHRHYRTTFHSHSSFPFFLPLSDNLRRQPPRAIEAVVVAVWTKGRHQPLPTVRKNLIPHVVNEYKVLETHVFFFLLGFASFCSTKKAAVAKTRFTLWPNFLVAGKPKLLCR